MRSLKNRTELCPMSSVQSPTFIVQGSALASVQEFRNAVKKAYCCVLPKIELPTLLYMRVYGDKPILHYHVLNFCASAQKFKYLI